MDKIYEFNFIAENRKLSNSTNNKINDLAAHTMKLNAQNFIKASLSAGFEINEKCADIILITKIFNSIRNDINFDVPSVKNDSTWKPLFDNIYNFSKAKKPDADINEICSELITFFAGMCGGALGELIRSAYPDIWEWKSIILDTLPSFVLAEKSGETYIDPCGCACRYIADFDKKGPFDLLIYSLIFSEENALIKNNYIYISGKWNMSSGKTDIEFTNPENDKINKTLYI